jgi:hypothetical protein
MSNWHHVCLKCAEGREYKPIGGLPKISSCFECGAPLQAGSHLVQTIEAPRVEEITFQMVAAGRRTVTSFLRAEKIAALLADTQPIGAFLRAIAGAAAPIAPAAQPTEPVAGSWGWGTSPDQIDGHEDDRDAAIEAAREQAEDGATVYVWAQLRDVDPAKYVPNAERIVEAMGDRAYDNQPESMQGEPWPDVTTEQMAELEALLEPIREWARKRAKSWWVADGEAEAVPPDGAK